MVELKAMDPHAFTAFKKRVIHQYAYERVRIGDWSPEDADLRARRTFDNLLPEGAKTPGHYLWRIVDTRSAQEVGSMWVQCRQRGTKRSGHLLDLFIEPPFRRKGYARQAMQQLEAHLQAQGIEEITLHVFEHNVAARALYQLLGFHVDEDGMTKTIARQTD